MRSTHRAAAIIALFAAASFLPRCAAPTPDPALSIGPGQYTTAFDAALNELRNQGFELDRIDARNGIITTAPRASAGLATLWIAHASTPGGAVDDTIHPDRRTAAIAFQPAGTAVPGQESDLRTHAGPIDASVRVSVLRLRRAGRHLDPTGIRLAGWWTDPTDPLPIALVPVDEDPDLAHRIARGIEQRLIMPIPDTDASPTPSADDPEAPSPAPLP
ncbi:MAG: hypothetical protein ACTS3F_04825 [Phycisphaerales bacterium]